jgi:TATA-binding protein-associated factor Taf7
VCKALGVSSLIHHPPRAGFCGSCGFSGDNCAKATSSSPAFALSPLALATEYEGAHWHGGDLSLGKRGVKEEEPLEREKETEASEHDEGDEDEEEEEEEEEEERSEDDEEKQEDEEGNVAHALSALSQTVAHVPSESR